VGQAIPETPLGSTTALLQRRPDFCRRAKDDTGQRGNRCCGGQLFPESGCPLSWAAKGIGIATGDTGQCLNAAMNLAGPIFSGKLEDLSPTAGVLG
jgi:hypothetical protein